MTSTDKQAIAARIKGIINDFNAACTQAAKAGLLVEVDKSSFDVIGGNPVAHMTARIMERIG